MLKDEIISNVVIGMSSSLDAEKLAQLKDCLYAVLYKYTIQETSTEIIPKYDKNSNEDLLMRFMWDYRIDGHSEKTIKHYIFETRKFLDYINKSCLDITKDDIQYYLAYLKSLGTLSASTLDNTRKYIKQFFVWLVYNDLISKNPFDKIKCFKRNPIKKNTITEYEITSMRDACVTKRELALVDFLNATGIRVSECTNVKVNDIDFTSGKCNIYAEKTHTYRIVYLDANALKHIIDYRTELAQKGKNSEYLFMPLRGNSGKRISSSTIENDLKKVRERCGLNKKVTVHTFRKTLASRLNRRGANIESISKILGHADSATTSRFYISIDNSDIQGEYNRYMI